MVQRRPSRGKRQSPRKLKQRHLPAKASVASSQSSAYKFRAEWQQFSTRTLPFILLILITIIAYANAWPNALAGDDPTFAVSDRFSGIGVAGVARFFTDDLWAVNGVNSGLYRPLLLVSVMIDSLLFGDWAAGYHLMNILLHVLATVMLYGLVRHLLLATGGTSTLSGYIALLAAVVFGVHPVNTEVVNSIFNRSEILVSVGTIGGLWWFLSSRESKPKKAWFGLCVIYLAVLLCKESGVTLPALTAILLWFTLPDSGLVRLKKCLPVFLLLIPLGIFLALRANALHLTDVRMETGSPTSEQAGQLTGLAADKSRVGEDTNVQHHEQPAGIAAAPQPKDARQHRISPVYVVELRNYNPRRLLYAVRLWADALKIVIWPHPLILLHTEPDLNFSSALALQLILLGIAISGLIYKRPALITGLTFFYIAILPASGIVGPLHHPHLAERFLYVPSAGLIIALAFGLRWLAQRFSLRAAMIPILVVTAILTPLTWARNAEWGSDLLLSEADYRNGGNGVNLLPALVIHNLQAKNTFRALEICRTHARAFRANWNLGYECGIAYEHVGRYDDATQAYTLAATNQGGAGKCYLALALMNIRLDRRQEAQNYFEQAMSVAYKPFLREYYTALMLVKLYRSDRSQLIQARSHLERSLQLQPGYFPARRMLQQVNEVLEPTDRINDGDRQ